MLFHHSNDASGIKKGVLLINFGTPLSPTTHDVKGFLREVLKNQNSLLPPWIQDLVVRTFILPFRINKTVARYRAIWTEEGSPLLVQSKRFSEKLSTLLPDDTAVALCMYYGEPSLRLAIEELKTLSIDEIIILPLFPQQVPPMTQEIIKAVFRHLLNWPSLPLITCVSDFYKEPWYIEASAARLLQANPEYYDHFVFSFHALPETSSPSFASYKNHCVHAAHSIAASAGISPEKISISFQSKAGFGRWTSPSTQQTLQNLLRAGKKRVLVMSPSFVVDCTETLGEIAGEYRAEFLGNGGEYLGLVESLNDFPPWVESVSAFIHKLQEVVP